MIGNNNPLRLEPIRIGEIAPGPTVDIAYFSRRGDATDPGQTRVASARLDEIAGPGSASREVIKSQAAALQSYWLNDTIATVNSVLHTAASWAMEALPFALHRLCPWMPPAWRRSASNRLVRTPR